jgi:hypothetical protein
MALRNRPGYDRIRGVGVLQRRNGSMRKSALIALIATAIALPAVAEAFPLGGPALTQRIQNGEFRGYTRTNRGLENQIWHFLPDGRIRAVADARVLRWGREDYQQWQDAGAWRVDGAHICVAFQGPNRTLDGCYAVDAGPGKQVRLVGPYTWQGTLEAHD